MAASLFRADSTSQFGFQTWDLADEDRNRRYCGHAHYVIAVAFSGDGNQVATASQDGTVRLWDLASGDVRHILQPRVNPGQVAFQPGGAALAVAGRRSVFVFDPVKGELIAELKGHSGTVKGLGYSPDGKYLVSIGVDGVILLRDATTNEIVGQRHLEIGKLGALTWLADATGVVVGGEKVIAVCELGEVLGVTQAKSKARGEPLSLAGHTSKVERLSYSRDGQTLVSWNWHGEWRFWDISGGAGQAKDRTPTPPPAFGSRQAISWSPDSRRLALATGQGHSAQDIADAQTGEIVTSIRVPGFAACYLAYTPSGRLFLDVTSFSLSERWTRFELRDSAGEVLYAKQIEMTKGFAGVAHVAFAADEQHVYTAFRKNGVYRWTPASGEVVRIFSQVALIAGLAIRDNERLALTSASNSAFLWTLPEGKRLAELKHPLTCSGAAFLPGGRVITACYDGVVRIWDESGREMQSFELGMGKVYSLAVSPDQMTFACGVEKKCRIVLMDIPE